MRTKMSATLLTAGMAFFVTALLHSWIMDERSIDDTFDYSDHELGIDKVDVKIDKKNLYLNVYIFKPLTCSQIQHHFDIKSIPIDDKVYVPACQEVSNGLIQIIYFETVST